LFELNSQKDGHVDLNYDDFDNVTLIIANAGDTNIPPPSWRVTITIPPKPPPPVYDSAIIALNSSVSYAFPEDTITITLTVKNNGTTRNEDFDAIVYWGQILIETRQILGLAPASTETFDIPWTIPSGFNGSHRVWANATFVQGDANPENNRLDDGILNIVQRIHDVAMTSISPRRTIVGNGTVTSINVTAANQGNLVETANVTLFNNSTIIGMQTITLNDSSSVTLGFSWNTTTLPLGNYTLIAEVSQVPGETDTSDNKMLSTIQVSILGDINGDGKVDMKDVSKVAAAFQASSSRPKWVFNGDLDENGVIDMKDISTTAKHFGEHYP